MSMQRIACLVLTLACTIAIGAEAVSEKLATQTSFDIPAQPLSTALKQLADQAGIQILFEERVVQGHDAPALRARSTAVQALTALLGNTGLEFTAQDETVAVRKKSEPLPSASANSSNAKGLMRLAQGTEQEKEQNASSPSQEGEEGKMELEEIVVTGTHIRGSAPAGSGVRIYTRKDIDQSGAATVDQFARVMTENFSNVDAIANFNSNANLRIADNNPFMGASFNLRGLGVSSTLTLLNGRRLAPGGFEGAAVDISQIPLSAVDHVEVLADGASAIYGADAVAGVVNIITRKDFNGAETSVRYGGATEGGAEELTGSQLLGTSWGSGNILANYEYDDRNDVDATERDYIPDLGGPYSILPASRRNSFFVSGNQALGADTILSAHAVYSDRDTRNRVFQDSSIFTSDTSASSEVKQSAASLSVDRKLFGDWRVNVAGNYSKIEQRQEQDVSTSFFASTSDLRGDSDTQGADVLINGSLAHTPGGSVKGAVGISYRSDSFTSSSITTTGGVSSPSPIATPKTRRHVSSGYVEVLLPLVGSDNAASWARRLEISAALRFDDYSDFGSSTNPKFGVLWEATPGLAVRASYGTSYRAPLLSELYSQTFANSSFIPDPSGNFIGVLFVQGGNPDLGPEKSESFNVGFDLKPQALPQFSLGVSYFNIDFKDRLSGPPGGSFNTVFDPLNSSFLTENATPAQVQEAISEAAVFFDTFGDGGASMQAIFSTRKANIALTRQSGIDLSSAYELPTRRGTFNLSAAVSRFLKNEVRPISAAPFVTLLNKFAAPPKLRGRGGVSWANGGFTASTFVNYINRYQNSLFTPSQSIDSWTTVDLNFAYQTGEASAVPVFRDTTLALSILNAANERPPTIQIPVELLLPDQNFIPFDPTNASPLGRVISLTATRRW